MKKAVFKIVFLIFSGIFLIYPVYPFLHECGHMIAALIVGGKEITLDMSFPPSVLCNIGNVSPFGSYIISVFGSLFPCIFSLFPFDKNYYLTILKIYINALGISACSYSIVVAILFSTGIYQDIHDDIVQALHIYSNPFPIIFSFAFFLFFQIRYFVKKNPVKICADAIADEYSYLSS